MKSWDDYGNEIQKSPRSALKVFVKWTFLLIIIFGLGGAVVSFIVGRFKETAQVAQEEFGPRALLQKYEYFKDVAAQLDAKMANLKQMEKRSDGMDSTYKGVPRKEWARSDLEQYNLWASEVSGVAMSYNNLAADYNAAMGKFNWAFCNAGSLPKGAEAPLPREFKPYLTH